MKPKTIEEYIKKYGSYPLGEYLKKIPKEFTIIFEDSWVNPELVKRLISKEKNNENYRG